jgi:hypothetical protein
MINHLVVNGASFTAGNSWAQILANKLNIKLHNLARCGAGNFYICNSTQDYLISSGLDPAETLVLIMWAGTGNKDLRISGEWWYHIKETYDYGVQYNILGQEDSYYLFSGGLTNSWTTNSTTKKIFDWQYKISDPQALCKDSLMHFINLKNFLQVNQYKYQFTTNGNCWSENNASYYAGNYSIGYFGKEWPMYKKFDFDNWVFVNQRDGLHEFALTIDALDDTGHPTTIGHQAWVDQIVIPNLSEILS